MLKVTPAFGRFGYCSYLCSVVWMEMAPALTPCRPSMAATECTQCVRFGLGETPAEPQNFKNPNIMVQPISISKANTRCRFCQVTKYAGMPGNGPEDFYAECINPVCNHGIGGLAIVAGECNCLWVIDCAACKHAEYGVQLSLNFGQ